MILRYSWVFGLTVALAASPTFGQAPASNPAPTKPSGETRPTKPATTAQTRSAPGSLGASVRPSQPGAPHTLGEALAATYANQPALQAERAKLRATDENVPRRWPAGGPPW